MIAICTDRRAHRRAFFTDARFPEDFIVAFFAPTFFTAFPLDLISDGFAADFAAFPAGFLAAFRLAARGFVLFALFVVALAPGLPAARFTAFFAGFPAAFF